MKTILAMTSAQHSMLHAHLFSDDRLESVAIILCHQGRGFLYRRLIVNRVILIPDHKTERSSVKISWPFAEYMHAKQIEEIDKDGLSIVTIHSHPQGVLEFSRTDDENDCKLFYSIGAWFDDDRPNGSAIMVSDGSIKARVIDRQGKFHPMPSVISVGEDILIWKDSEFKSLLDYERKSAQTFGKGTINLLKKMRVGIVGCSGTGSIIAELAARSGVGEIVLIDDDIVEQKNLNRIVNSTLNDAHQQRNKVDVIAEAISDIGLNTSVYAYPKMTDSPDVVVALIDCDILFGCVDSAFGRYHLDCIASAYFIPYFDVGVGLQADGYGGIEAADTVVHYVHPEGRSLLSRDVYAMGQVHAENIKRLDDEEYQKQKIAGYLADVGEDQPAVISLNMQAACMAFNDFLARIHRYRLDDNGEFSTQRFQLVHGNYEHEKWDVLSDEKLFSKYRGTGDKSLLVRNNIISRSCS